MTSRAAGALAAVAGAAFLVATACTAVPPSPAGPPTTPAGAATALIDVADAPDFDDERLAALFGDLDDGARADLIDALAGLRQARQPRVTAVEPLDGLGRAHVDVVVAWGDAGEADLALQVATGDDGTLRVQWFQGPDVEWPTPPRTRDDGVTTSAPPDGV